MEIDFSKVASPPKAISPLALKVYKALARPYDALAAAFMSGKWEKLRGEADFGQTIWRTVSPLFLRDTKYAHGANIELYPNRTKIMAL